MMRLLLKTNVFLLGLYSLSAQVVLAREILVVFWGNELVIALTLAAWLAGIGTGALLTGAAGRAKGSDPTSLVVTELLMLLLLPLSVALIRTSRSLLDVPAGELVPFVKVAAGAFLLVFPIGYLVGAVFPLACRLLFSTEEKGKTITRIYVIEAAGSMAGGLLLTFLLIPLFHPFPLIFIISAPFAASTALLAATGRESRGKPLFFTLLAVSLVLATVPFTPYPDRIEEGTVRSRFEGMNPGTELIRNLDSKYQNLALGGREEQYALYGNGSLIEVFPDRYFTPLLTHLFMTEARSTEKVLLLGGGAGGMLATILRHPVERLDFVQLDPSLLSLMR